MTVPLQECLSNLSDIVRCIFSCREEDRVVRPMMDQHNQDECVLTSTEDSVASFSAADTMEASASSELNTDPTTVVEINLTFYVKL